MAGETPMGSKSRITTKQETIWGTTPATPTMSGLPYVSETLKANQGIISPNTLRPDRRYPKPLQGNIAPAGDINIELAADGHGRLFYYLLGGVPTITGAGPYTHVIEEGMQTDLPSFTLEKAFTDVLLYVRMLGCRISKMNSKIAPEALVDTVVSISAKDESMTTELDPTPVDIDFVPCDTYSGFVKKGTTIGAATALALLIAAEIDIDNQLFPQNVIGQRTLGLLLAQRLRITGSLELAFSTNALYNEFRNFTQFAWSIQLADALGSFIQHDVYSAVFSGDTPQVSGEGPVFLQMGFEAFRDSVSGKQITTTVENNQADLTTF